MQDVWIMCAEYCGHIMLEIIKLKSIIQCYTGWSVLYSMPANVRSREDEFFIPAQAASLVPQPWE